MLLYTQIRGRIGSPRVAGSTRRLSSGTSSRLISLTALRPPPARRTCPFASGSAPRSSSPRLIVERASPVISATIARPPQPAVRTSAAANRRRPVRRACGRLSPSDIEWRLHRSCNRSTPVRPDPESRSGESYGRTPTDHDSVIVRPVLSAVPAFCMHASELPNSGWSCPHRSMVHFLDSNTSEGTFYSMRCFFLRATGFCETFPTVVSPRRSSLKNPTRPRFQ